MTIEEIFGLNVSLRFTGASTMVEGGGTESRRKSTASRRGSIYGGEKPDDTVDLEVAITNIEDQYVTEPEEPRDPNVVDWDGPDDPENPLNWPSRRKVVIVTSISVITFITYGFGFPARLVNMN